MTSLSICTFLRNISIYTFHGNVVVAEDHIAFYPVVNLSLNRTVVRFSKVVSAFLSDYSISLAPKL